MASEGVYGFSTGRLIFPRLQALCGVGIPLNWHNPGLA
jgi:hypothetical protein